MANRFWILGTGTWDAANTASWSTTSGGSGGASVPGTGDVAIFDANSGGGIVTVDSPNGAGVVTIGGLTFGTFTGTLDFSVNNNNVTIGTSTVSGTGTGVRTFKMGSGTWTFAHTGAVVLWEFLTTTNLTFEHNSSTILINGDATANQTFSGGGLTYNNLTISRPSANNRQVSLTGNNTFANLTMTNVGDLQLTAGQTQTITGALSFDGLTGQVSYLRSNTGVTATINVANATVLSRLAISGITKAGAGSITANDSYDVGNNSGITINTPAVGGGGGSGGFF